MIEWPCNCTIASQSPGSSHNATLPVDLTVISNVNSDTENVATYHKKAMTNTPETVTPLATDWQFSVYSLPHVAQPIAPEDPIYGSTWAENEEDVYLGQLDALGEKGMLIAASESMVRLRYNPCFEYPEKAHPGLDRRRRKRIYLKRGVAGSANQK